jgi:hypothetical protein
MLKFLSADAEAPYTTAGFSAELFESIYGVSLYRVHLRMKSIKDWNTLMKDGGASDCMIQWMRVNDGGASVVLSDWRTCRLRNYTASAHEDAVAIQADFVDGMFRMMNRCPRAMFKKKSVADIAKEIIKGNKLEADVDEFSTTQYTLCQCGMSDYEFIREVLIPRASADPVLFYTKAGNTISLKQRKKKPAAIEFNNAFTAASDEKVPIGEFKTSLVVNNTNFGILGVAFDPLKTQKRPFSQEFLASDFTIEKDPFAPAAPKVLSLATTDAGKVKNIIIETLGLDIKTALEERVRPDFAMNMHRVAVVSYLLPKLELGATAKLVTETYQRSSGAGSEEKAQGAGEYMVYALYHTISAEDMTTVAFLERRGFEG